MSLLTLAAVSLTIWLLLAPEPASAVLPSARVTHAIPAFARKYGLPCSACHEAWPKLNNFGQVFRDSGYQLMNERDSPITRDPSYFPITFRNTPNWHREYNNRLVTDAVPGSTSDGLVESHNTTSGFDLSGIDIWTGGTLYKNISFLLLPSADENGSFHFEAAWVRFDNLLNSSWLNLKFGKHELDTPVSEKRMLTLSNVGGSFYNYHFVPVGDTNTVGAIGDNQLGVEIAGHSRNSYTRYSASLVSANDGEPGFAGAGDGVNAGHTYAVYYNVNQAFELPKLGLQRVGAFGFNGKAPTYSLSLAGEPIPGTGQGSKGFSRVGVWGLFYAGKFDLSTVYMHGSDDAYLGTATPSNQALPTGAASPSWNGGFAEVHYSYNPQLVVIGRYEVIKMSQQALATNPSNLGNTTDWVLAYRWYPIMFSRGGLAWHMEYAHALQEGVAPISGRSDTQSSLFAGFDFDF